MCWIVGGALPELWSNFLYVDWEIGKMPNVYGGALSWFYVACGHAGWREIGGFFKTSSSKRRNFKENTQKFLASLWALHQEGRRSLISPGPSKLRIGLTLKQVR
ncbi:hypothetical protein LguiB_016937 [Lonicera macranthoides]